MKGASCFAMLLMFTFLGAWRLRLKCLAVENQGNEIDTILKKLFSYFLSVGKNKFPRLQLSDAFTKNATLR